MPEIYTKWCLCYILYKSIPNWKVHSQLKGSFGNKGDVENSIDEFRRFAFELSTCFF